MNDKILKHSVNKFRVLACNIKRSLVIKIAADVRKLESCRRDTKKTMIVIDNKYELVKLHFHKNVLFNRYHTDENTLT